MTIRKTLLDRAGGATIVLFRLVALVLSLSPRASAAAAAELPYEAMSRFDLAGNMNEHESARSPEWRPQTRLFAAFTLTHTTAKSPRTAQDMEG